MPYTCEICGREIYGKPLKVKIGNSVFVACPECARNRIIVQEEKPKKLIIPIKRVKKAKTKPKPANISNTLVICENAGEIVRKARERLGLKREELARKLNIKKSYLESIEAGRTYPDVQTAKLLERYLKVKIITVEEEEAPPHQHSVNTKVTLGEIIRIKKRKH